MSITGNLKTMELSELMQWLSQGNKTGTMIIDNGQVKKQIHFRGGRIISSASTDPKEHLGHFLVGHGFINENELANAIQMQEKTGMLLGKILVTIGAISEQDLNRLLRLKAEESLYDIFSWSEGEFRFLDEQLPERTFIPMDLEVTGLVLEGARRMDEWALIRRVIPSAECLPVAMVDRIVDNDLTPGEQKILDLVDDEHTIEEIALETHASEFHVCRVIYEQVQKKAIKVVKPRWSAAQETQQEMPDDVDAKSLVEAAERHLDQDNYEQALRHLRAARSLEPESKKIQGSVEAGEQRLRDALAREGVTLKTVPELSTDLQELTASKISPQEGFMLTRINGTYDIEAIVKISPIPQLDALLVFWRLLKEGHIRVKQD
jgi:AraC-like DNA-binding protein